MFTSFLLPILDGSSGGIDAFRGMGIASAVFNILAASFLVCALIPAYLDARKFQKTFFLEENFFKFFFFGATAMLLNAIVMLIKCSTDSFKLYELIVMFVFFIISNCVSSFVNHYSWNMKRRNMRESQNRGISEQQYWETVIAPTLEGTK